MSMEEVPSLTLAELLTRGTPVPAHRPWPRVVLDRMAWTDLLSTLHYTDLVILGLWGEPATVHLALFEPKTRKVGVFSLSCPQGTYPSVGRRRLEALRLERALADLTGLKAEGNPDPRPWLDHGTWPLEHPLGAATPAPPEPPLPYPFQRVEGESLHQIPVGPVHAGIIEPGHFRFTAQGETVVRLEGRLGYVHKGIERLMTGAALEKAARLAGRVSGDSTVAWAWAFARAAELATNTPPPPRAVSLRAVFAELERIAAHISDVGFICNDAAYPVLHAACATLRERILRTNAKLFGHRLLMDTIVPGGVAVDIDGVGRERILSLCHQIRLDFNVVVAHYEDTLSLLDRTVTTGIVSRELVQRFGAGGVVGRGSGRVFDARRQLPYAPYDGLNFVPVVRSEGDVNSRVRVRMREVHYSLNLIKSLLHDLPDGPLHTDLAVPEASVEGLAAVESFRGDVLVWLRLGSDGRVERCHLRDPSWFQWPLLEAAIEHNIVADFPLCNKSFNCSYSGHDL